jgi:hypothetical protein
MYPRTMDTTLDAWEILQAVVQLGGFGPAAKKLNRSQSTISYAIGRLQEQLGVRLFEIHGRKAQLTEAGRVLLADVEPHLAGFHELEQRARVMASGGASEIRISVDSIFPDDRLFGVLAAFSRSFPRVRLTVTPGYVSLCRLGVLTSQRANLRDWSNIARTSRPTDSHDRSDGSRSERPSSSLDEAQTLAIRPDAAYSGKHRKRGIRKSKTTATAPSSARSPSQHNRIGHFSGQERSLLRLAAEIPHSVRARQRRFCGTPPARRQDARGPAESGLQRLERKQLRSLCACGVAGIEPRTRGDLSAQGKR